MERAELARALGAEPGVGDGDAPPRVIEASDPAQFMEEFADAVAGGGLVFLADPAWGARECGELSRLVAEAQKAGGARAARGWLLIPTGGTSGRLKFARHDEETISAAVLGFCGHFGLQRVNAVGVLPLHHVGGLMGWLRCAITGGDFVPCNWRSGGAIETPLLREDAWVLSIVPTQLQRLLRAPETVLWLRQFRIVFVSGGPVWPELADAAARAGLRVSLTYGMTETAAMVAALEPEEFLGGERSCGTAMPHARLRIADGGVIAIEGESVFRGYWPEWREAREFVTEDLGRLDARGHLHVLGRRDAVIITGGKKVHPSEVEAALRASGEFEDVAVIGVPDPEWGEAVVACYPGGGRAPDLVRASAELPGHQRPKRFVAIADWPRNAQGKVNREALRAAVLARRVS